MQDKYLKGVKVLLVLFLVVALFATAQPAAAQSSATCTANGRTYSAGQYFYNTSGQLYICNGDGSIAYLGYTLGSPPMYPYPFVYSVPNQPQSSVQCTFNGNHYNVGQTFWDPAGRQFTCNSDGSLAYMGVVSSSSGVASTTCTAAGCVTSYPYYSPNVLSSSVMGGMAAYPYATTATTAGGYYPYAAPSPYGSPYGINSGYIPGYTPGYTGYAPGYYPYSYTGY